MSQSQQPTWKILFGKRQNEFDLWGGLGPGYHFAVVEHHPGLAPAVVDK